MRAVARLCATIRVMTDRPEQRPEGRLIAIAQKRPRLSNREAAARAGMSEGHWRAIVSGSRSMGKDFWVSVKAPPETLARMAQVVGVTPEQLVEAERPDAAEELRALPPPPEPEREPTVAELAAQLEEVKRQGEEVARGNAELARKVAEFEKRFGSLE
jgi:hypothetical protein